MADFLPSPFIWSFRPFPVPFQCSFCEKIFELTLLTLTALALPVALYFWLLNTIFRKERINSSSSLFSQLINVNTQIWGFSIPIHDDYSDGHIEGENN
jgi:hypothetical protein